MEAYTIYGALGSPYSIKMRAVLRYRRLSCIWKQVDITNAEIFRHVKAPVIPVIQFPDGSWHNDSTQMIFTLERQHTARSIVPTDPAQAFLAFLLEDFADEWGTKAMFHYRWFRERDQKQVGEWLAFDRLKGHGRAAILEHAQDFAERQIGRMALVGCTPQNAPLIEETAHRILSAFERFVTEGFYLFGTRPSLADFAWLGQLSQLASDPTPQETMLTEYPFTYRWLANLDDASGVEGKWLALDAPLSSAVNDFLKLAGEIYFPFLKANERALRDGADTFTVELLDQVYTQATFKYQAKCLTQLRLAYATLDAQSKTRVNPLLESANCLRSLLET